MISVIIPTYNSGKYISEAIHSVLAQTYKNTEIIVIDDGSSDDTRKIIQENYPDIRYYYIDHQGVSKARNFGIKKAQGDFIAFLDADDVWLPEKLFKQREIFSNNSEIALVFTESCRFNKKGFKKNPYSKRKKLMNGDIVKNIFRFSYVGTPTVMVKREVFEKIGYFEENLQAAEDDNLWMRIALEYKIDLIDEILVHIRIRSSSITETPGKLFDGVVSHINIIKTKYPKLRDRLGNFVIRRRLSGIHFDHGYYFFCQNQFAIARKYLYRSFFLLPNRRSLLYLVFSFFSKNIIESIKKVKRIFRIKGF